MCLAGKGEVTVESAVVNVSFHQRFLSHVSHVVTCFWLPCSKRWQANNGFTKMKMHLRLSLADTALATLTAQFLFLSNRVYACKRDLQKKHFPLNLSV